MAAGGTTTAAGSAAEQLAADHLVAAGYRILARNHRCAAGEVDLIAWDGDVLCFVEVRSLRSDEQYDPLESITRRKIRRVVHAARHFLETLPHPWPEMRFDAVGIVMCNPPKIELVRDAFEA